MTPEICTYQSDIDPLPANHDNSRFQSVSLADH